jgi:ABC-type antimicrobial peptide transport system permease subunit
MDSAFANFIRQVPCPHDNIAINLRLFLADLAKLSTRIDEAFKAFIMLDSAMTLSFTPHGILLWLAVVIVLSVFVSIMPARNATRLTINEVLAYE